MSYKVTTTGKASHRAVDLECPKCQYPEERVLDCREFDSVEDAWLASDVLCPNCEEADLEKVWRNAPLGKVHDEAGEVSRMKQSFKERFIKKDVDDVRHKHGKLYDDSIRSAAAQRIKPV